MTEELSLSAVSKEPSLRKPALPLNEIVCGDVFEVLKGFPDESVDLVVTDPPYGYSFMGKNWDRAVPSVEVWKECLRVLKSGAFAFVMSSPRQDVLSQMIVRLGIAGFDMGFSSIYWTYACLSEDTEVLTENGWEQLRNTNRYKGKKILTYDCATDKYRWEIPLCWNSYQIKDTCYRIKSDFTDQLITRNHHILVEREGKILFTTPERAEGEGLETLIVPYLEDLSALWQNLSVMAKTSPERKESRSLLFNQLSSESQYSEISVSERQVQAQDVRTAETETARGYDGRKESSLERWHNLLQDTWQLCWSKICSLPSRLLSYGTKRWLRYGTSPFGSSTAQAVFAQVRSSSPYRPRPHEQCLREFGIIQEQSNSQAIRTWAIDRPTAYIESGNELLGMDSQPLYKEFRNGFRTDPSNKSYRTTLATITREHYQGLVFCPTVSTGCFVARRKGKIFLTGNSGFPKAMNISKAVDKRNGRTQDTYKPFAEYLKLKREEKGLTKSQIDEILGTNTAYSWWEGRLDGVQLPTKRFYLRLKELLGLDNRFDELIEREEAEREIISQKNKLNAYSEFGYSVGMGQYHKIVFNETLPATESAKALDGSYGGFQPKPAIEIIIVCMKPLSEKTFVDQALKNGKGVSWLDDARIPFQNEDDRVLGISERPSTSKGYETYGDPESANFDRSNRQEIKGRFPANLLVSDDILNDGQERKTGDHKTTHTYSKDVEGNIPALCYGKYRRTQDYENEGDSGSFSRYFDLDKWFEKTISDLPESVRKTFPFLICAKASKSERNKGCEALPEQNVRKEDGSWGSLEVFSNTYTEESGNPSNRGTTPKHHNIHPTVKPLKLMSYLVTLGSRPNDVVLDPFVGSGTTCLAAEILNRKWIGIDNNPEYCEIGRKRLATVPEKLETFMKISEQTEVSLSQ